MKHSATAIPRLRASFFFMKTDNNGIRITADTYWTDCILPEEIHDSIIPAAAVSEQSGESAAANANGNGDAANENFEYDKKKKADIHAISFKDTGVLRWFSCIFYITFRDITLIK